ncbi:tail fiber domain-containing protein [Shewanella sp. D64]|uniref:tail fiber domain-containing protein n=1 Tax=unclassified Shewanella TaxID=196818 RepID=UPI0022BA1ECD|nr:MULTISPECIES: tail fiber domain-containing protein [unclassified Shewanella]MEC4724258.1 tail fiber domain-containing protein [Shewanella sp. D64]MEC4738770.1 tail fiber domain-containing protein [Shewanella sp. E94]WBJ97790.1 tail fiber domain-containing protein [Shewanella sp. MTB7]
MTAGAWYRVGVVDVTHGSSDIVGAGTSWINDVTAIAIGDMFTTDTKTFYEVIANDSDLNITLDRPFEGDTSNGINYAIIRNSSGTINTRLAGQISRQFNQKQQLLDEWQTWCNSDNPTEPIHDSHGVEHQVLTLPSFEARALTAIADAEGASTTLNDLQDEIDTASHAAEQALSIANDADGLIQDARTKAVNYATHPINEVIPGTVSDYSALHHKAIAESASLQATDAKAAALASQNVSAVSEANALSSKNDAAISASSALESKDEVATSASNAAEYALEASNSKTAAESSNQEAIEARIKAEQWAQHTDNSDIPDEEVGSRSAKHYAGVATNKAEIVVTAESNVTSYAQQVVTDKDQVSADKLSSGNNADAAESYAAQALLLRNEAETFKELSETAALTLTGALSFGGGFDASAGSAPIPPSETSIFYKIIGAGTIANVDYEIGDSIVYDNIGHIWFKLDNTEQVTSVNGKKGAVVLQSSDVGSYSQTQINNKLVLKQDKSSPGITLSAQGSSAYPLLAHLNNPCSSSSWFRVGLSTGEGGVIPYANGFAYIGTSTWKFKAVTANSIYGDKVYDTGQRVYCPSNKPSPGDIGAAVAAHGHTGLAGGSWGGIKSQTSYGYIDFGPANTSHAHIYTDRPNFYFNKELLVNGHRVYHPGYKPSPSDIGAAQAHSHPYLGISDKAADAALLAGIHIDTLRQGRNANQISFSVGGDANTYYPVLVGGSAHFGANKYSITRGYYATAPDSWYTPTHKGGLTLTWIWSGDRGWGGNDKVFRIEQFDETYSTMVAGMTLTTSGLLVWLRGGGATYYYQTESGTKATVSVHLGTFTASNGATYAVRTNTSSVTNEILNKWPVRDYGSLYDNGARAYSPNNKPTLSVLGVLDDAHAWTGTNSHSNDITFTNYGRGVIGTYSSTKFQNVFSMGAAYKMAANGTSLSAGAANFYGIGWTHSNNSDINGSKIAGHHAIFCSAGVTKSAIGDSIWTGGALTANGMANLHGGLSQDGKVILNGSDTWLRTHGANGWYSATYGGGLYMTDTTYVRTFGGKRFYCDNAAIDALNTAGGVMSNGYHRKAHHTGHLVGSYNNIGSNSTKSNPIYTIGSSYNPSDSALGGMYGIGFTYSGASFIGLGSPSGWGMYVAADGDARIFLNSTNGGIYCSGDIKGYQTSDIRTKRKLSPITDALENIAKLRCVHYEKKSHGMDDWQAETGLIAQDVKKALPKIVQENEWGELTIKQGGHELIALALAGIKELTSQNQQLLARITDLERKV